MDSIKEYWDLPALTDYPGTALTYESPRGDI